MTGYESAKEMANSIKSEKDTTLINPEAPKEATAETGIQKLDEAYFAQYQNLGMETVEPEDLATPVLKIIQPNSKDRDEDGRPYKPGVFLHTSTKRVIETPTVSFLKFEKSDLPDYTDKNIMVKTYIYYGALLPEMEPFKMFMRKTMMGVAKKLNTDIKESGKPMFALNLTLSSHLVSGEKGDYYVMDYKINGVHEDPNMVITLEELTRGFLRSTEQVDPSDVPF